MLTNKGCKLIPIPIISQISDERQVRANKRGRRVR